MCPPSCVTWLVGSRLMLRKKSVKQRNSRLSSKVSRYGAGSSGVFEGVLHEVSISLEAVCGACHQRRTYPKRRLFSIFLENQRFQRFFLSCAVTQTVLVEGQCRLWEMTKGAPPAHSFVRGRKMFLPYEGAFCSAQRWKHPYVPRRIDVQPNGGTYGQQTVLRRTIRRTR